MSFQSRHFIDFSSCSSQEILFLFDQALNLKGLTPKISSKSAVLVFLEPSTRTQISFELALRDCGIHPVIFNSETSSLKKGESVQDTLLNLEAMGVDLFVIRHGDKTLNLKELSTSIRTPIINAGEGVSGHPTQALGDCYTIFEQRKLQTGKTSLDLKGEKILFVGDVRHSRVFASNSELMTLLGAETAVCAPKEFTPSAQHNIFENLEAGLEWATVVMALRTQFERHNNKLDEGFGKNFVINFSLNTEKLSSFRRDGIILHPGPVNRGFEIQEEVFADPRNKILKQVENGRKLRHLLINAILGENE